MLATFFPRRLVKYLLLSVILGAALLCITFSVPAAASYMPFNTSVNMNVGIGTSTPQGALVVTNGNVGIGTWAPSAGLAIGNTGNGNSYFAGNVGVGTSSGNLVNNLGVQGSVAVGSAAFAGTAGPPNGLIVSGNVGIGSTTPGTALDINGRARLVGIGTTVPQALCMKLDGSLGYYTTTTFAGVCN